MDDSEKPAVTVGLKRTLSPDKAALNGHAVQPIGHIDPGRLPLHTAVSGAPVLEDVEAAAEKYLPFKRRKKGKKYVWLDVDTGVDDAQGMMLALANRSVEVVGISCVCGNVGLDQVVRNVARVLQVCGRGDVPFYIGAAEPLVAVHTDASEFHGLDGLGDTDCSPSGDEVTLKPAEGHAVNRMIEAAVKHEGNLVLIATGPLTNVALALKLDPQFPKRVAEFYVMGGSVDARGNTSAVAEFNFFCDPESAYVTLRSFPWTVVISWECTLDHALSWDWFDQWVSKDTSKARFMKAICAKSVAESKRQGVEWVACDPIAVAVALEPKLVQAAQRVHCLVELHGNSTRGQSIFDKRPTPANAPNVVLVNNINMERFKELMDLSLQ